MKRLTVAVALLTIGASEAHAFDCPSTGDSCPVSAGQDRLNFNLPLFGIFSDNVILGQVDLVFGRSLAACVNGDLEFDFFGVRPAQARDAVLCLEGGNDTVRVLASGETASCRFLGLPITMTAWQSNGYELAIYGQGGNDTIYGGDTGPEQICGGTGNDKLFGRGHINEINGGPGDDDITGGNDLDYLFGADGNDIIVDPATGGFRQVCNGGQNLTPSRLEGGAGNDCIQVPPTNEPGWCYAQEEACNSTTGPICHGGLWCGDGYDRVDTPALSFGAHCEVKTQGVACTR